MFDPIEIAQLGPEVVRIVAMVIRAKKAKSPGGQKLTEEEKDLIRDALEELLLEAAEDARD